MFQPQIIGYESVGLREVTFPPPASSVKQELPRRSAAPVFPRVNANEAREALIQYAKKRHLKTEPAENVVITKITYSQPFHYKLTSFCEKRQSHWSIEPHRGSGLLTPTSPRRAPSPWEINVTPEALFIEGIVQVVVPNSTIIHGCFACGALGFKVCPSCSGEGKVTCIWCDGSGWWFKEPCKRCREGLRECLGCKGSGRLICNHCQKKGRLKYQLDLIIAWSNHVNEYLHEPTILPEKIICGIDEALVLQEEYQRVSSITNFDDPKIYTASTQLIKQHAAMYFDEKMIAQRQELRVLPVSEVVCKLDGKPTMFYVYGLENEVYIENYPHESKWCICCRCF